MVRRGRGRGPNSQRRQAAALRQRVNAEHRRNDGAKLVPRLTPPQFIRLPWNTYTYSGTWATLDTSPNQIDVTVGRIRQDIITRMGLAGTTGRILLKIQSGHVWQVATGNGLAEPNLRVWFYEIDPDAPTYNFRSEQADHGTLNRPARCGYQYPLRDSKQVLSVANDSHILLRAKTVANEEMGNITIRVKVLWLCSDASSPAVRERGDIETIADDLKAVEI